MLAEKETGTDANNKSSLPGLFINNMHIVVDIKPVHWAVSEKLVISDRHGSCTDISQHFIRFCTITVHFVV